MRFRHIDAVVAVTGFVGACVVRESLHFVLGMRCTLVIKEVFQSVQVDLPLALGHHDRLNIVFDGKHICGAAIAFGAPEDG